MVITARIRCRGLRGATRSSIAPTAALSLFVLFGLLQPLDAQAQDDAGSGESGNTALIREMAAACGGGNVVLREWCREVALAFQAAQGGVGLLGTGGGSLFPGNASTLGRRFGTTPRLAGNLQLGLASLTLPRLTRDGEGPADERSSMVPALHATVGAGLFDGFSPLPTVGGVLAVDGIASANLTLLPSGQGFRNNVFGYGIGLRLGLLRESFTLPGVSISGMMRGSSTVRLGEELQQGPADIEFDLTTYSLRGTVGKDFFLLGILAGAGYDRYKSDADLGARLFDVEGLESAGGRMSPRSFTTDRAVFFGGATLTYLVLQFAAEGGWARGLDDLPGRVPGRGEFDPTDGTLFLTLSGRLTL